MKIYIILVLFTTVVGSSTLAAPIAEDDDSWADTEFSNPIGPGTSNANIRAYNARIKEQNEPTAISPFDQGDSFRSSSYCKRSPNLPLCKQQKRVDATKAAKPIINEALDSPTVVDRCPSWTEEKDNAEKSAQASRLEQANSNAKLISNEEEFHSVRDQLAAVISDHSKEILNASRINLNACLPGVENTLVRHAFRLRKARSDTAIRDNPSDTLLHVYRDYLSLKHCYVSRAGTSSFYISDDELALIRSKTKVIEAFLANQDRELDKDAVWNQANRPYDTPFDGSDRSIKLAYGLGAIMHNQYSNYGIYFCDSQKADLDNIEKALGLHELAIEKKDFE